MKDAVPQFGPHPTLTTQSPHHEVASCDFGRAPTARGDTLHGLTTIRDPGSKGHLEPAMKDAVLKSGPHPTLATQSPHRDVTSCDRDGARTAFDIALRKFRDTWDGFQTMPDLGSRSHHEPTMKDAVLESGTQPTLVTQSSKYDIALRDFRRARAERGDVFPGLATIRGHGSKTDLEPAVKDASPKSGPHQTSAAQPPTHTTEGASLLSIDPHVTQCATNDESGGRDADHPHDALVKSSTMPRTPWLRGIGPRSRSSERLRA